MNNKSKYHDDQLIGATALNTVLSAWPTRLQIGSNNWAEEDRSTSTRTRTRTSTSTNTAVPVSTCTYLYRAAGRIGKVQALFFLNGGEPSMPLISFLLQPQCFGTFLRQGTCPWLPLVTVVMALFDAGNLLRLRNRILFVPLDHTRPPFISRAPCLYIQSSRAPGHLVVLRIYCT